MKTTIATATLLLFLSSFCFSDTVTSHVNERGQIVFTNTGPSPTQQAKRSQDNTEAAIDEIWAKHPEMDATRTARMVQLTNHFIEFGNPTHVALLKAERRMIEDGELIDHEAVAAEKIAAEQRRQREIIEADQREKREIEIAKQQAYEAKRQAKSAKQEAEMARQEARKTKRNAHQAWINSGMQGPPP